MSFNHDPTKPAEEALYSQMRIPQEHPLLFGPALPTSGSYETCSVRLSVRLSVTKVLILSAITFLRFFAPS